MEKAVLRAPEVRERLGDVPEERPGRRINLFRE